jgi:hypothetical protein
MNELWIIKKSVANALTKQTTYAFLEADLKEDLMDWVGFTAPALDVGFLLLDGAMM